MGGGDVAAIPGPRIYSCCNCRCHVADHDEIISKCFQVGASIGRIPQSPVRGIFLPGFVRAGGGVVSWFRSIGVGFGDAAFECLFFWVWVYHRVLTWIPMVRNPRVWGWYGGNCRCLGCYGGNCCCNCRCLVAKSSPSAFRWGHAAGIGRIPRNPREILLLVIVRAGELWRLVSWVRLIGVGFGDAAFDCLVFWVWVYHRVHTWIPMVLNLDCYGGKIACHELWMCPGSVAVAVEAVRANWSLVAALFATTPLLGLNYGHWNPCASQFFMNSRYSWLLHFGMPDTWETVKRSLIWKLNKGGFLWTIYYSFHYTRVVFQHAYQFILRDWASVVFINVNQLAIYIQAPSKVIQLAPLAVEILFLEYMLSKSNMGYCNSCAGHLRWLWFW